MLASDSSAFTEITAGSYYSCENLSIEVPTILMPSRLGMVEIGYAPWYGC